MEQVLANRCVSITELKRSPTAVLEQAGTEPVAVLNHNRPAAYLVSPEVYGAMLARLTADLRTAVRTGIDSGPGIPASRLFAELEARYADPGQERAAKPRKTRQS